MSENLQDKTNHNPITTENELWLPPSFINHKAAIANGQVSTLQRPPTSEPEAWKAYWKAQGWQWRTEPEIDAERQKYLAERRSIVPNIKQGIYPFKEIEPKLSRADVEWLLVTHENGRGPVDWSDESQRNRKGLDLRGADLQGSDLHMLPLACMCGSLNNNERKDTTEDQRSVARIHLERAVLFWTHLENAMLIEVHMELADLASAHLQQAHLLKAHMEGAILDKVEAQYADLRGAYLEGTAFPEAHLEGALLRHAFLYGTSMQFAYLQEADLRWVNLAGAKLNDTHLEGTRMEETRLEGTELGGEHLKRIRSIMPYFSSILSPTDLSGVLFNDITRLNGAIFGNKRKVAASVADIHWGGTNLTAVDWTQVAVLSDEFNAAKRTYLDGQKIGTDHGLKEYQRAVRANRQLAVVLQSQGLNEDASRFAYRAQLCQRVVLRQQKKFGQYLFSLSLDLLAGYGYRPGRSVIWYLATILVFALAYHFLGGLTLYPPDAFVFSVMSFHGRGFFPALSQETNLHNPLVMLAAAEAIIGLLIEISFIATFTQRFFGR